MKRIMLLTSILISFASFTTINDCSGKREVTELTTYYLIRHAEKIRNGEDQRDPPLKPEGQARAERWARYFKDKNIDAIYSTAYKRTRATAQPTADLFGLGIEEYDPSNLYDDLFAAHTKGKNIVIVGHSNTTPQFVNAIIGEPKYSDLPDNVNNTLYVVTISSEGKNVEIITVD